MPTPETAARLIENAVALALKTGRDSLRGLRTSMYLSLEILTT